MKYYVVNSTYRKEADGSQTLLDQTAGWVDDPTGALFENAEQVKVRSSQGPVLEGLYRTRDDRYLLHRLPLIHYREGDSICWMRAEPAEELSTWAARAWAEENLTPEDFQEAFRG